jgi:hypothetical protein
VTYRVCYLRENGTVDLTRGGLPVAEINEAIRLAFNQRRAAIVNADNVTVWIKEGRRITDLRKGVK